MEVMNDLDRANKRKHINETFMNHQSSRSHTIMSFNVKLMSKISNINGVPMTQGSQPLFANEKTTTRFWRTRGPCSSTWPGARSRVTTGTSCWPRAASSTRASRSWTTWLPRFPLARAASSSTTETQSKPWDRLTPDSPTTWRTFWGETPPCT